MKTRGRRGALALAAALLVMALCSGMSPAGDRSFFLPEQSGEGFVPYENAEAKFSLEVPEDYTLTEPYVNVALVSDGDDFRLSAEYTFYTADQAHCLYSAAEFAALIEADTSVLADWIGSAAVTVSDAGWGEAGGTPCYICAFSLPLSGVPYAGVLYLFDGQGQFGCYCLQGLYNTQSDKAALYAQQIERIAGSFAVTGPYQGPGYTLFQAEHEGQPVRLLLREGASAEQSSNGISVYPADGVYSQASIRVAQSVWDAGFDVQTVLTSACSYYFEYQEGARYLAQPSHFDLGDYTYDMIELEYEKDGAHHKVSVALFVSGDNYWKVTADASDAYADAVAACFSDVLFSLRVGDGPAAGGAGVGAVLDEIQALPGFHSGDDGTMTPIGSVTYLDDGGRLLVAVYELVDGGEYTVYTDAWLLEPAGATLLARGELYQEAGGNSGIASVTRRDGAVWLALERSSWQGENFSRYYTYLPLEQTQARFGTAVRMEARGTAGQEELGQYWIDGEPVDKAAFDSARAEYVPDLGMPMNIRQGPGNGNVVGFDALRILFDD